MFFLLLGKVRRRVISSRFMGGGPVSGVAKGNMGQKFLCSKAISLRNRGSAEIRTKRIGVAALK